MPPRASNASIFVPAGSERMSLTETSMPLFAMLLYFLKLSELVFQSLIDKQLILDVHIKLQQLPFVE